MNLGRFGYRLNLSTSLIGGVRIFTKFLFLSFPCTPTLMVEVSQTTTHDNSLLKTNTEKVGGEVSEVKVQMCRFPPRKLAMAVAVSHLV